ncbi:MAG TPA: enoyl-CoA hydratase-related protein, partial [Thermomicrobiales bacterium]|nr:enoyl-CoA hydratase-related protein [Thermomicrobiales bacterium]
MTLILVDRTSDRATITLNRPEARNALSRELVVAFRTALADLALDVGLRVLVITAAPDAPAFCAGADLVERMHLNPEERLEHLHGIAGLCEDLAAFPTPVIAAIRRYALAGGTEIALACDLRVAEEGSTFGLPEALVGIIPGAGGITRLPKLVGTGLARDLMFTGRRVTAEEAKAIGMIEYLVPAGQLEATVEQIATQIADAAPLAIRAIKRALRTSDGLPQTEATAAVLR